MKPSETILANANRRAGGPVDVAQRAYDIAHAILEYLDGPDRREEGREGERETPDEYWEIIAARHVQNSPQFDLIKRLVCSAFARGETQGLRSAGREDSERERATVAGEWVTGTIQEHARRCEVLLAEEQRKANPDNALVACLCDSVRLTREFERGFPPIVAPPEPGGTEVALFTLANEICGPLGRAGYGPEHDAEMALILERLERAKAIGAEENDRRWTYEFTELKQKLADAETSLTERTAAHLFEHMRAEKAESARDEAERKLVEARRRIDCLEGRLLEGGGT